MTQDLDRRFSLAGQAATPSRVPATIAAAASISVGYIGNMGGIRALARALLASRTLSLIDQAVVSGTSLFVTVVIGRFTVPSQLGIFALIASLIIALQNVQNALISSPYTIQRHHPCRTAAEHAGSTLALCVLLALAAAVFIAMLAWIIDLQNEKPILEAAVWTLAAMAPFIIIREFGRDYAFAHLQMSKVLLLDLGVAAIQVGTLSYLAWSDLLSTASALATIGTACGVTGLLWLYLDRKIFLVRMSRLPEALRQSWKLGRWILANQLSLVAQVNLSYWLVAVIAGTTATGIYAASMCVASLANPLVLGLSNIMFAQATLAFKEGGYAKLRHDAFKELVLLSATMTLFCLVIVFAGEQVLQLFFSSQDYLGHRDVLVGLALWQLAHAIGIPASNALSAMERVRLNFYIGLATTCITAAVIAGLVIAWGLVGAAIGLLIGSAARSAVRWGVFLTITEPAAPERSRSSKAEAATQVLRQLTDRDESERLKIVQIDVGSQAHIFTVRSSERRPVWLAHEGLVVKLYKQSGACSLSAVFEQRDALLVLHKAIHGLTFHGWKIFVPEPLHVSQSPPALIMTMVPGQKLSLCLETEGWLGDDDRESAARAISAAMQRCWSALVLHGDLAFHNILCDVPTKTLSFVDAGALSNCCKFEGVIRCWTPAAHDLAHILCDVSTNVKRAFIGRGADARNQKFSASLLWAYLESIGPDEAKQRMLDELRDCTRCHVRAIGSSMSPHGLWHLITMRVALRRVDTIFSRILSRISVPFDPYRGRGFSKNSLRARVPIPREVGSKVRWGWLLRGRS